MKSNKRSHRAVLLLALACIIMLFACHHKRGRLSHAMESDMHQLEVFTLASGNYCGIEQGKQLVISSTEAWEELWKKVYRGTEPEPELPVVDFSKETVLAVFMGTRSTGGYSIEISGLAGKEEKVKAIVKTRSPLPGEMVSMALTQPFHIVKVNKAFTDIEFIKDKQEDEALR